MEAVMDDFRDNNNSVHENYATHKRSRKMLLWLGIVGMIMVFAALTSAYIVAQGNPTWEQIPVPNAFYFSTVFILLSSGAVWFAQRSVKSDNQSGVVLGLLAGLVLGIGFVISQWLGWVALTSAGFHFAGEASPAGSYMYMITGMHLAHMVAGIITLLVTSINALRGLYTARVHLGLELASIFWHFLGVLWVYLLLFLLFIR